MPAIAGSKREGDTADTAPKKRRKRKPRLPKDFDPANPGPPPDPERWLAKWQRSDYKKKKDRNARPRKVRAGLCVRHIAVACTFLAVLATQSAQEYKDCTGCCLSALMRRGVRVRALPAPGKGSACCRRCCLVGYLSQWQVAYLYRISCGCVVLPCTSRDAEPACVAWQDAVKGSQGAGRVDETLDISKQAVSDAPKLPAGKGPRGAAGSRKKGRR